MKIIAFTVADQNNMEYAKKMANSFHYFHPDIEVKIYTEKEIENKVNFYRQKPMFARELIKEYDLVIGLDADQIITGDLSYLFNKEFDIAVPNNFCRNDIPKYGYVTVFDVPPDQYMNCGIVMMKSKAFIDHWWTLCNSYHFERLQYKEQDLMNIMIHYGQWNVLPLDAPTTGHAWHGLLSKGEWLKMKLVDNKLILPKAEDMYPEEDKEIKIMHWAGGGNDPKLNYRLTCSEEVINYLDELVKDRKHGRPAKKS